MRGGENHFEIIVQTVAFKPFREMFRLSCSCHVEKIVSLSDIKGLSRSMLKIARALYVQVNYGARRALC